MTEQEKRLYVDVRYDISALKTALLIGCYDRSLSLDLCRQHLDELEALATTYGLRTLFKAPCPLRSVHPATYLGKGKVAELAELAAHLQADVILFDDEISPNQQRELEKLFCRPIIDRTELILEIFSQHARTKEAKLQIELAQSQYQLPRLKRLWTHLSRQSAGGKGFLKGAGERQIEIDRRLVRRRISQLQKELKEVRAHRAVQRQARLRSELPTFSLVGYTNVGKSTLLHALTEADVLIENKLFATLDTKAKKYTLPNSQEIVLVDTVGFIRKLPHTLIEAFRSTLEEARYTDILIHLIDVNHPLAMEHAASTYEVLRTLEIDDKPIMTVLNKVDLLESRAVITRFKLKYPCVVPLSATTRTGFSELIEAMTGAISSLRTRLQLRIPQKEYAVVAKLMEQGHIIARDYEGADILLDVELPTSLAGPFRIYTRT